MEAKYTAKDIAKWMILHNQTFVDNGSADLISNLKLQKLLYYAQGVFLAANDKPLFDDDIVAWQYGPVVENVYQKYKKFGSNGIECDKSEAMPIISPEDACLLSEVMDEFGKYSAIGLMYMTHSETPWRTTDRSEVISKDKIKRYFKEHYVC